MVNKENKAILVLNFSENIYGAEKRYITLFNHIYKEREDYFLIINESLYDTVISNELLDKSVKIIVIKSKRKQKQVNILHGNHNNCESNYKATTSKRKSKVRITLGQFKYFFKQFIRWIIFAKQFINVIKKKNFKIVYAVWTGGIWAWPFKRFLGFKLIHSFNDSGLSSVQKGMLKFFDSEYWVLKYCYKIDFLSKGIINDLGKAIGSINPNKTSITPNSFIDYHNYYPQYPKENFIIFMSRLTAIKNPMLFLKAIKILSKRMREFPQSQFYILGDGPLGKEVLDFIKTNGLSNVHFEGMIYEPWKYLRKSTVFISIQSKNNYPSQSLIEAMACENAIIASDVGETRKLVTENEGFLVNLDAEEIANAIEKLFTTPGLIEKLGKNARKKVLKEHTIEKYAEYFYTITQ